MIFRIFSGILASALAIAFFAAPVLKLKNVALTIVIAIGIVLMIVDLVEKIRKHD